MDAGRGRNARWLRRGALAVVVLGALAGCGNDPGWTVVGVADVNAAQARQVERAGEAKDLLSARLSERLLEAAKRGGPAAAIAVCKDEAPRIATEVGAERGLKIGRTSHRLRNPDNASPAWAESLVEERVERPRYLVHADGRLAALLPIRTAKRCLPCHGGLDDRPEKVRLALEAAYPQDEATGFREGGLRGWFWLEVPPAQP